LGGVDTQCQFLKEVGTTLLGVHPLSHFLGGGWPHFFTFSSSAIVHFLQEHLRANSPGLFNPSSNFCQKMCVPFQSVNLPKFSQHFLKISSICAISLNAFPWDMGRIKYYNKIIKKITILVRPHRHHYLNLWHFAPEIALFIIYLIALLNSLQPNYNPVGGAPWQLGY
jgi:hypothetical protein